MRKSRVSRTRLAVLDGPSTGRRPHGIVVDVDIKVGEHSDNKEYYGENSDGSNSSPRVRNGL
jgi:hypothetical protein